MAIWLYVLLGWVLRVYVRNVRAHLLSPAFGGRALGLWFLWALNWDGGAGISRPRGGRCVWHVFHACEWVAYWHGRRVVMDDEWCGLDGACLGVGFGVVVWCLWGGAMWLCSE